MNYICNKYWLCVNKRHDACNVEWRPWGRITKLPKQYKKNYRRENTAIVHVLDGHIKPHNIIKFVREHFGVGSMFALVPRSGNFYEITLDGRAPFQYLLEGINIWIQSKSLKLNNDQFTTSPAYIEDHEIEDALHSMNIEIVYPIKRRYYPGTNIVDWTITTKYAVLTVHNQIQKRILQSYSQWAN